MRSPKHTTASTPEDEPDWAKVSARLTAALHLTSTPVALTFESVESQSHPVPAAEHSHAAMSDSAKSVGHRLPLAPPNEHGRTGAVPAGCVFWIRGSQAAVTTYAEDHANCSVGSLTHGFRTLDEVAGNDDVQALLSSGWVDQAGVMKLPVIAESIVSVTYAPLPQITDTPDVVLVRTNASGLMTIKDAIPDLRIEGKPQCHVVALAKEGQVAASVGCALSRARTGMRVEEATVVFPGGRLPALVSTIEHHAELNSQMARYAGIDARRFANIS
jgi:uncharacterized protein (DUF169 family)